MSEQMSDDDPGNFGEVPEPPQVIGDLWRVAKIDPVAARSLSEALQAEDGFLEPEILVKIIHKHVATPELASSVGNVVTNLRKEMLEELLGIVDTWRQNEVSRQEWFTDERFTALCQTLPILVQDYPAIVRMMKAHRLRTVVGNNLKSSALICDLRPVFNEDRSRVEGLFGVTTWKLDYERQNGSAEELELILTPAQLDELADQIGMAQQKLRVLRASFALWIPDDTPSPVGQEKG